MTAPTTTTLLLLLLLISLSTPVHARWKLPFIRPKPYTPLIFLKQPDDPDVEAAERMVRRLERETGVRVERLDLSRQPEAQALLEVLNESFHMVGDYEMPVLYHRESRQLMRGSAEITEERVRAWAKGRLLRVEKTVKPKTVAAPSEVPKFVGTKEREEQEELLQQIEEMALTQQQREGKQLIQERTEALVQSEQEK